VQGDVRERARDVARALLDLEDRRSPRQQRSRRRRWIQDIRQRARRSATAASSGAVISGEKAP
jgi:hypothetical protein